MISTRDEDERANPRDVQPRPLPAPDQAGTFVADALTDLLGRKPVLTFIATDAFVARLVARMLATDEATARRSLVAVGVAEGAASG